MNLWKIVLVVSAASLATTVRGQAYQEYEDGYGQDSYQQQDDNLYHNYAMRQQEKEVGAPGFGWPKILIGAGAGWVIGGKVHSSRKEKKLNAKFKQEQKELYTQYYNDVYTLQQQNAELVQALEQMGARVR